MTVLDWSIITIARDKRPASGTVAAALGLDLVLDVHCCSAAPDHRFDSTPNVKGTAPSRINIDQHRQIRNVCNTPDISEYIIHGADAEVRDSQGTDSYSASRNIKGPEAGTFGKERCIRVYCADNLKRLFFFEGITKQCAG
jgi:hypothetical protein